ncbi:MAG: hypothetical protein ACHBN1_25335 [Heteroscytonema crispum UTEX LB 1556]
MSTIKGIKGQRDLPIFHEQVKKPHTVLLTPLAWDKLRAMADEKDISISELIENWARDTTS